MRRAPAIPMAIGACIAAVVAVASCTTPASPGSTVDTAATTATATGTGTPSPTATTRPALVVETVFDHTTLDPTRQSDGSGLLLTHALYQTLTTLDQDDPTLVEPGLAEYSMSPEGNWLTLRLRAGASFSDGTAITSDDVIFTLSRAAGLRGESYAMLGNLRLVKVDDRTLTITSPGANFALPAILANPVFGILNADVVRAHGGAIGPGDSIGPWLTSNSAGSGPYVIASTEPGRSVTLRVSALWAGPQPQFPEVIVRNASPKQQVRDVQSGAADVVLDLSPAQADAVKLKPAVSSVSITSMRSFSTVFLLLNRNRAVNRWTADDDFREAVGLALDTAALARSGGDARPALGLIPEGLVGAFRLAPGAGQAPSGTTTTTPAPTTTTPAAPATSGTPAPIPTTTPTATATPSAPAPRDLDAAKAALARSGYRGQTIPLTFASALPIHGMAPAQLAAAIRSQLAQVGIRVRLDPQPTPAALEGYRTGRQGLALWSWSPDYLDPEAYLAFGPGRFFGTRGGWALASDPEVEDATVAARAAYGDDRPPAFARWQEVMNDRSPFLPLIHPFTHHAHGDRVTELPTNPVWTLDLAGVR